VRNFWFVTNAQPTGVVKKFIGFAQSPNVQRTIVAKNYVTYK
jgi:ABC-type thiamine transport system substrate-binding protein